MAVQPVDGEAMGDEGLGALKSVLEEKLGAARHSLRHALWRTPGIIGARFATEEENARIRGRLEEIRAIDPTYADRLKAILDALDAFLSLQR